MSTPDPVDDDSSYPEAWTPPHIRRRRQEEAQQREEFEIHVAALSDAELKRIRGGQD